MEQALAVEPQPYSLTIENEGNPTNLQAIDIRDNIDKGSVRHLGQKLLKAFIISIVNNFNIILLPKLLISFFLLLLLLLSNKIKLHAQIPIGYPSPVSAVVESVL